MIVRRNLILSTEARFSDCETYRYYLRYSLTGDVLSAPKNALVFCMLNPSRATEATSDATVTRCRNYALAWGHSDLIVVNAFALRSTDPKALYEHADPVGPLNDAATSEAVDYKHRLLVGWGIHGTLHGRQERLLSLFAAMGAKPYALKVNDDGSPSHPLYLRADLKPVPFGWAA